MKPQAPWTKPAHVEIGILRVRLLYMCVCSTQMRTYETRACIARLSQSEQVPLIVHIQLDQNQNHILAIKAPALSSRWPGPAWPLRAPKCAWPSAGSGKRRVAEAHRNWAKSCLGGSRSRHIATFDRDSYRCTCCQHIFEMCCAALQGFVSCMV